MATGVNAKGTNNMIYTNGSKTLKNRQTFNETNENCFKD